MGNADCESLGPNTKRLGMGNTHFAGATAHYTYWTCNYMSEEECRCGGHPVVDAFCKFTDNPHFAANGFDNILQAP